jgi:hypothetical protein
LGNYGNGGENAQVHLLRLFAPCLRAAKFHDRVTDRNNSRQGVQCEEEPIKDGNRILEMLSTSGITPRWAAQVIKDGSIIVLGNGNRGIHLLYTAIAT